jgi:hypothetical protein
LANITVTFHIQLKDLAHGHARDALPSIPMGFLGTVVRWTIIDTRIASTASLEEIFIGLAVAVIVISIAGNLIGFVDRARRSFDALPHTVADEIALAVGVPVVGKIGAGGRFRGKKFVGAAIAVIVHAVADLAERSLLSYALPANPWDAAQRPLLADAVLGIIRIRAAATGGVHLQVVVATRYMGRPVVHCLICYAVAIVIHPVAEHLRWLDTENLFCCGAGVILIDHPARAVLTGTWTIRSRAVGRHPPRGIAVGVGGSKVLICEPIAIIVDIVAFLREQRVGDDCIENAR